MPASLLDPSTPSLDRLDARTRILITLAVAVGLVGLNDLLALGGGVVVSALLLLGSRAPLVPTLKRMAAMDGFVLFILAALPFSIPGTPLFSLSGLTASQEGLAQALRIGFKANAIILTALVLLGSLEPVILGHALHQLGAPLKLVHLLLFTVRYVDLIHQEYARLRTAMKVRAFSPASNRHTWKSLGYLIGMILVRAVERSERILASMKCRGFSGHLPILGQSAYGRADLCAVLLAVFVLAGLWGIELAHVRLF